MRKAALLLLVLLFVFAFAGAAHAADQPIRLFAAGKELRPDAAPYLYRDRVMVPLRAVSEAVGFGVMWAPNAQWPVQVYPTIAGIFGSGSVAQDIGFVGMRPGENTFVFVPRKTSAPGSNVFTGQHD